MCLSVCGGEQFGSGAVTCSSVASTGIFGPSFPLSVLSYSFKLSPTAPRVTGKETEVKEGSGKGFAVVGL